MGIYVDKPVYIIGILCIIVIISGCTYLSQGKNNGGIDRGPTTESSIYSDNATELSGPLAYIELKYQSDVILRDRKSGKIIRIDPFNVDDNIYPDYIFITHNHYDHCSAKDVRKILLPTTEIYTTEDCAKTLKEFSDRIKIIAPGDRLRFDTVSIDVVRAYNISPERIKYHPKENNWVGFVIAINGYKYYISGDTGPIPEIEELKAIDVAFVPIDGKFTMTPDEAANWINKVKPKYVVPYHFNEVLKTEKRIKSAIDEFRNICDSRVYVMGYIKGK